MTSIKRIEVLLAAGIVAGLVAVFLLSGFLETRRAGIEFQGDEDDLSLQGERLKGYALGFEGLLADWYWVRSLQYIGNKIHNAKDQQINIENLRPLDPKLLYPFLNNASTLDPNFLAVYSYGATVLPAIDEQHAIEIAEKGIENNPAEWQLYHQLGYIYWRLRDF
ncbi:MAG: hypothetical protein OEM82_15365, partial [Acidobacteriota bacterium]|nr:hypothetical protein [Acidobacteriota bacterium]